MASKKSLLFFLLPPFIFALSNIRVELLPRSLTRIFAFAGGYWLGFFYYSVLLFVIFLVCLLVGKLTGHAGLAANVARYGFFAVCAIVVWGGWTALHPVYRNIELETAKEIKDGTKIAFVSDIHLGGLFGNSFAKGLAEKINGAEPDLVIIGGDIIDGNLDFVVDEGSYKQFGNIKAPLGVYAVYGNHDRFFGSNMREKELLGEVGVKIICDEQVNVGDYIEITGLNDYGRGRNDRYDIAAAGKTNPSLFKIFVEHQPRHLSQAGNAGFDISFSGHTHAGQFFPNRLVTKRMYELDYGAKKFGGMLAIVSNGYGLWGVPIRVGNTPEVVVVTLKKKK